MRVACGGGTNALACRHVSLIVLCERAWVVLRACRRLAQSADTRAGWSRIKLPHAGPQSAVPEPVRDGLELSGA
eukprot:3214872-Rhodomonas_salina.2